MHKINISDPKISKYSLEAFAFALKDDPYHIVMITIYKKRKKLWLWGKEIQKPYVTFSYITDKLLSDDVIKEVQEIFSSFLKEKDFKIHPLGPIYYYE